MFASKGIGGLVVPLCVAFAAGVGLMAYLHPILDSHASCAAYDLLNPHLPCEGTFKSGEWDYEPMRDAIVSKTAALKKEGKVAQVSVFFRDLNNGPRFGVGEYKGFQPASLMKLPVMIAFLHEADGDPSLLDRMLSFSGSLNTNQNTEEPGETIQPDTPYTIRELIRKMIIYSDNYSYLVLTKAMNDPDPLLAYYTFRDLGVLDMMMAPKADYVSIQSYGGLFAVLYNTGYLSKEMSQFALKTLSEATYDGALVAGVPNGTVVAHKFGHRILPNEEQLHDCGIVYHPAADYVLCVMTSGADEKTARQVIADLSKTVYDGVSEAHAASR